MRRYKIWKKSMIAMTVLLGGGTVLDGGCLNTLASVNVCGTFFTFCTPADQLNLIFPYLTIPDFKADPSCTIPLGCGANDVYQNISAGFPGGSGITQPSNSSSGVGGSGGSSGGGT